MVKEDLAFSCRGDAFTNAQGSRASFKAEKVLRVRGQRAPGLKKCSGFEASVPKGLKKCSGFEGSVPQGQKSAQGSRAASPKAEKVLRVRQQGFQAPMFNSRLQGFRI